MTQSTQLTFNLLSMVITCIQEHLLSPWVQDEPRDETRGTNYAYHGQAKTTNTLHRPETILKYMKHVTSVKTFFFFKYQGGQYSCIQNNHGRWDWNGVFLIMEGRVLLKFNYGREGNKAVLSL